MEYLDFELPIKELEDQLEDAMEEISDLTSSLNKNIGLDKGDFIFAAINIFEDNSFSVTNTILRLCFNSSIFFLKTNAKTKLKFG